MSKQQHIRGLFFLFICLILLIGLVLTANSSIRAEQAATATSIPTNTPRPAAEGGESTSPPADEVQTITVNLPADNVPEDQILRIESFEVDKTTYSLEAVRVVVRNLSDTPVDAWGWYLLALPGEPEPWNRSVYHSPEEPVEQLAPGETATFEFGGPNAETGEFGEAVTFIGEFQLSMWVHRVDPATGERIHADGAAYDDPIVIGPGPLFLTIDDVRLIVNDPSQAESNATVNVKFSIHNYRNTEAEIGLSYSIASPDDPTPWLTGIFNMPFKYFTVLPNQRYTITYQHTLTLPRGSYELTGWLHEVVNGEPVHRASYLYPEPVGY